MISHFSAVSKGSVEIWIIKGTDSNEQKYYEISFEKKNLKIRTFII